MAWISTNEVDIGMKAGATWDTAADMTSGSAGLLHASTLSVQGAFDEFSPRDIGFDNFRTKMTKLGFNLNMSITCDMTYNGLWVQLLAAFMGTTTASPAETTVGEGDYAHNIDLASSNTGKFVTLAFKVEDDYALEIPSFKVTSVSITQPTNGVGQITFNGIGSRIVDNASVTNSIADINALSYPTYEECVLGNTNHYLRIDTYSTVSSLTNSDDKKILSYTLSLSRPLNPRFALRGADSKYTIEPLQLGVTTGTLAFQMAEIDNSQIDGIVEWLAATKKMAEIFIDGTQIGAGVNRSFKFQMPYMELAGAMPTGYDVPSNNALMQPTFTYNLLAASAAPSGMTGVTKYLRVAQIGPRSAAWL